MDLISETRLGLKRNFSDFLDHSFEGGTVYGEKIRELYQPESGTFSRRLVVDSAHLRTFNNLLRRLTSNPAEAIPPFEDALREYVRSNIDNIDWQKQLARDDEMFVGIKGDMGHQEVSPRNLKSSMLGQLVKVRNLRNLGVIAAFLCLRSACHISLQQLGANRFMFHNKVFDYLGSPMTSFASP